MLSDTHPSSNRERNDKYITKSVIHMDWMFALYTFAMVNDDISTALDKRHIEIFKKDWYVAWFKNASHDMTKKNSENKRKEEIKRPELLNNERTRRELRRFLIEASDMLLIFKFVGIYYVKDMEKWIEQMSLLDAETIAKHGLPLPFGVIPLENVGDSQNRPSSSSPVSNGGCSVNYKSASYGNYVMYTDTRTLRKKVVFECNDDARAKLYNFEVFDIGARFVSVHDGTVTVPNTAQQMAFNHVKNINPNEMVPASPFMALYKARSEIEEYIVYRGDTNFNLSHPSIFLSAKPLPNTDIEVIPEDVYCAMDTVLGAKQHESLAKQRFAMNSLQNYIDRMHQNRNLGNHVRPQDLLREQRREKYARADLTEGSKAIPGYVDITMGHPPTLQVNIQDLESQFKYNVSQAVRIPYVFLRNDGQSSGGGKSSAHSSSSSAPNVSEDSLNFHRNNLYEEMDHEHSTLNDLFRHFYGLTYSHLDHYMISRQLERDSSVKEKKKKNYGSEDDDDDEDKKKEKEMHAMKESGKKAQHLMKGISIELFFEKSVVRSASSLPMLMQLAQNYIVPLEYVAAHSYSVYGSLEEMQIDKLPPMPKIPPPEQQMGGGGGGGQGARPQAQKKKEPKATPKKKESKSEDSGDEAKPKKKEKEKDKEPKKTKKPAADKEKK